MVKRWGILLMVMCFAVTTSWAQSGKGRGFFKREDYDDRVFYGGLVAGMNFSTVDGDGYSGYHKVGFNGGGIVYIQPAKRLLVSLSLLYSQKGSRGVSVYDSYYTGTTIDKYWLNLNYVEVPLVLHLLLNDKWQIGSGASYARLLTSTEGAYSSVPTYFNASLQQFHQQDIEYIISGTMQFYTGWFLDATYQYSVSTIRDADKIPVGFGGGAQYNGLFSLRLIKLIK